jgi:SagB-type dehydrogenase family enzyme
MLVCNYATRVTTGATPLVCEILHACDRWRTIAQIRAATNAAGRLLPDIVDRLVGLSLLERSDQPPDPRAIAMSTLDMWNPEVGFFHAATKDVHFWSPGEVRRHARVAPDQSPMPRPVKRYPRADKIALPPPAVNTPFTDVLLARRTSRRYSSSPISISELSSILALSAGVQQWAKTGAGDVPLKTSPSGGARHPIECYAVVRAVTGLKAGIYHYRADRHELERVHGPVSLERMRAYVPKSEYFAKASAMVFFTAVFERQLWRYPYSRAYRAALIEAGHVCQTGRFEISGHTSLHEQAKYEASWLAGHKKENNLNWRDYAVLYRNNAYQFAMAIALDVMNIPHTPLSGQHLFQTSVGADVKLFSDLEGRHILQLDTPAGISNFTQRLAKILGKDLTLPQRPDRYAAALAAAAALFDQVRKAEVPASQGSHPGREALTQVVTGDIGRNQNNHQWLDRSFSFVGQYFSVDTDRWAGEGGHTAGKPINPDPAAGAAVALCRLLKRLCVLRVMPREPDLALARPDRRPHRYRSPAGPGLRHGDG